MAPDLFDYAGQRYPEYLRHGNACRFVTPFALEFCKGIGIDVGAGPWPLPGAIPVDLKTGTDAHRIDEIERSSLDYVFSSHCLEHLTNPVAALEHWRDLLKGREFSPVKRPGGLLFLYLPHPDQVYWRPEFCRKHLHSWTPERMVQIVESLGFVDVIHSQRDLAWSFAVIGRRGFK